LRHGSLQAPKEILGHASPAMPKLQRKLQHMSVPSWWGAQKSLQTHVPHGLGDELDTSSGKRVLIVEHRPMRQRSSRPETLLVAP